jgi:hypothetical protein
LTVLGSHGWMRRLLLGEAVPIWPIEDALGTLRTIAALLASARSGTWEKLAT